MTFGLKDGLGRTEETCVGLDRLTVIVQLHLTASDSKAYG